MEAAGGRTLVSLVSCPIIGLRLRCGQTFCVPNQAHLDLAKELLNGASSDQGLDQMLAVIQAQDGGAFVVNHTANGAWVAQ